MAVTSAYLAILLFSSYALIAQDFSPELAFFLFAFQIVYKILTLVLIKDKKVPVYWFNLGVVVFHSITLSTLFRQTA